MQVLENNDVEGTRNYTMRHEVSGLDPNWMLELGSVPDVTVVVTDNDSIGLKIDPDVLELVELGDFQAGLLPRCLPVRAPVPCSRRSCAATCLQCLWTAQAWRAGRALRHL